MLYCTGRYQGQQVIADFIKQRNPPEETRADFSIYIAFFFAENYNKIIKNKKGWVLC